MVASDSGTVQKMLEQRMPRSGKPGKNEKRPIPFTEMDNLIGAGNLFCEVSVSAKQQGIKKLSDELWARALKLAPLSQCVHNNWQLIDKEKNITASQTSWAKFGYCSLV